ncbi:hypothetical protein [Thermobispora bispora]|uniref:hypothetical protein n=1 Tax=Thermobispora bispora TaxID=2006 RepID=UPI00197E55B3|nr:hypothetical protein [Thermobispora bispora]MBX6166759.1 hypothetical protein [Thermobispora bispora]MDI9581116.1 hypothetical protein [Thermobispora sp.]
MGSAGVGLRVEKREEPRARFRRRRAGWTWAESVLGHRLPGVRCLLWIRRDVTDIQAEA